MALTTYTGLKTEVANWLNRDDLTTEIVDFIAIAENKVYRVLRIPATEVTVTLTTDATTGKLTVPTDFIELKGMALIDGDNTVNLERIPVDDMRVRTRTGVPLYYARLGQEWQFDPKPDAQYDIDVYYYKQLDPLATTTNETNYFTSFAPEVLLYGALAEAYLFLHDIERHAFWNGKFKSSLQQLQGMADQAEWASTPMSVRGG